MGQSNKSKLPLLVAFLLILLMLFTSPKAHSQVFGLLANGEQTQAVLQSLINSGLLSIEVRLGPMITAGDYIGQYQLVTGQKDEDAGRICAAVIEGRTYLQSIKIADSVAKLQPSTDEGSLRCKLYKFFGGEPKEWSDGPIYAAVRQDADVRRSTRVADQYRIQYLYSKVAPVWLFEIKIINWPGQPLQ